MAVRQRKVFGRRRVTVGGATFRIEMRKNSIVIRELYSRRERTISLAELVDASLGQMTLKLN